MLRILFVGNFLSKKRGTKGIAERLAERSNEFSGITLKLTSYHANKVLRLLDIIYNTLLTPYNTVVIDVYSGAYFFVVRITSFIATLRGKKIILNLRGGKLHEFEEQNCVMVKRVMARAATIITPSLFLKNTIGKRGYSISYLPNFIDIEKFSYQRKAKPNTLLWVRAFATIYNPQMPIRVLELVRREFHNATLTMVGPDHGLLDNCLDLIDMLNLKTAITITGQIENHKLPEFFHTHSVYLNTTSYESFGLAVMEAASCGTPIVSNRVGEIPYIWLEGEEILLVDEGNVAQMADHAIWLLKNDQAAHKISIKARVKVEQFLWEKIKPIWLSLFRGQYF